MMWTRLKNFLRELGLRISSMKQPWFYNRVKDDYLKEMRYDKGGY